MADTTFVDKVTKLVVAWGQAVNDFVYKGRNPNFATTTGSANAQVLTLSAGSVYAAAVNGDRFTFVAGATNTGAATLTIVGSVSIPLTLQMFGVGLTGGEIVSGRIYDVTVVGSTAQLTPVAVYPRTSAEISNSVTPTSYQYPPGDLRRYGADVTGTADSTSAINNTLTCVGGGTGLVLHPGGTIKLASTITVPNGITISGFDRSACIFNYTGTGDAFNIVNPINSSGYGKTTFNKVKVITSNGSNAGCGIEINGGGFAYYEISECWITGFKYPVLLDSCEVTHVHHNIIEAGSIANSICLWIVSGPDRRVGQTYGRSNNITINDNQLNGTQYGLVDDGGATHKIKDNNFNGHAIPMQLASLQDSFVISGNEVENAGLSALGSVANILFTDTSFGGVNNGACQGGFVNANELAAGFVVGSTITFGGSSFHKGISVTNNFLGSNLGRVASIDVTKLANSFCGYNYDAATGGQHYTGTHNNTNGNTLLPPQNGYSGGFQEGAAIYGDTRYPSQFLAPVIQPRVTVTYSASITIDVSAGAYFEITATDGVAFAINAPTVPASYPFYDGQRITITIANSSGGALGAVTWNAVFHMSAWTQPADGKNRSIDFELNIGTGKWRQISQTGVDVPN